MRVEGVLLFRSVRNDFRNVIDFIGQVSARDMFVGKFGIELLVLSESVELSEVHDLLKLVSVLRVLEHVSASLVVGKAMLHHIWTLMYAFELVGLQVCAKQEE